MFALTAAVAGALFLLFPKQSLMDKVHAERGNDSLTAGYIAALLRTEPANHELRLLLAEKRYAMGQMALARTPYRSRPRAAVSVSALMAAFAAP